MKSIDNGEVMVDMINKLTLMHRTEPGRAGMMVIALTSITFKNLNKDA